MFAGLGDGELRKIARLFVQKLYRPGEQVFAKGDSGDEAFIVLRGKISIQLESGVSGSGPVGRRENFRRTGLFGRGAAGRVCRRHPAEHFAGHETDGLRRSGAARA